MLGVWVVWFFCRLCFLALAVVLTAGLGLRRLAQRRLGEDAVRHFGRLKAGGAVVAFLVGAVWTAVADLFVELVVELPGAALDPVVGEFAGWGDGQDGVAGERYWLAIRR